MIIKFIDVFFYELLIASPIVGIILSALLIKLFKRKGNNVKNYTNIDNKQQLVNTGDGNVITQVRGSSNKNIHNHYHGNGYDKGPDDPLGFAIAILCAVLGFAAVTSWFFAKHGQIMIPAALILLMVIGFAIVTFIMLSILEYGCDYKRGYTYLIVISTLSLNIITLLLLKSNFRDELANLAEANTNVLSFYMNLSTYGKSLITTQVLCFALICISLTIVAVKTIRENKSTYSWILDTLVLTILGFLPLWLSHPNWAAQTLASMAN